MTAAGGGAGNRTPCDTCGVADERMAWLRAETRASGFETLDGLHIPVPGYADFLAGRVARIFDNLKADQPVQRFGWSLYADDDLSHAAPRPRPEGWPDEGPGAFVRLERQTLRRLQSGESSVLGSSGVGVSWWSSSSASRTA